MIECERQPVEVGNYKNLKELLKNKDKWVSKLPITKDCPSSDIKVDTDLNNEVNEIHMTVDKKNSHYDFRVNSVSAGLTTINEFFDLLKYLMENNVQLESSNEPWLTPEVISGLNNIKEKIQGNKITKGMQQAKKPLGRPSDKSSIQEAIRLYNSGDYTGDQIQELTGVSRTTLYRHMKK